MSNNELILKIEELKGLQELISEAEAEAEAIKDSIKQTLSEQGVEEMEVGTHIIRWKSVLSQRFDGTAFKKKYEELYKAFTKQSLSKRFTIS